jgi:hypothetical protein
MRAADTQPNDLLPGLLGWQAGKGCAKGGGQEGGNTSVRGQRALDAAQRVGVPAEPPLLRPHLHSQSGYGTLCQEGLPEQMDL